MTQTINWRVRVNGGPFFTFQTIAGQTIENATAGLLALLQASVDPSLIGITFASPTATTIAMTGSADGIAFEVLALATTLNFADKPFIDTEVTQQACARHAQLGTHQPDWCRRFLRRYCHRSFDLRTGTSTGAEVRISLLPAL